MSLSGDRTFIGFGFGAIEAGLFLYEAFHSENFKRLIVAEIKTDAVDALRASGGLYTINVAYEDRVESEVIGPIEVLNPENAQDRERLVSAIAEAEEFATALPSVKYYVSASAGSIHRLLAEGFTRKCESDGPPAILYAAENNNHAAELLESAVLGAANASDAVKIRSRVSFLNTVIGKMSGVVGADEIKEHGLAPVNPGGQRAFLVESFNRILISKLPDSGFSRGITVFEEKPDLLPFEEAKLYGHNSTHAVAAYFGALLGAARISDLKKYSGIQNFLECAFIQESGAALTRKHRNEDFLFTTEGYRAYAKDLLVRMFNPYLGDTVERVARDPARKLEWDDRLVGTIRLCLRQGVNPRRYAIGAAAAIAALDESALNSSQALDCLMEKLWANSNSNPMERRAVLNMIEKGGEILKLWRYSGYPNLECFASEERASHMHKSLGEVPKLGNIRSE